MEWTTDQVSQQKLSIFIFQLQFPVGHHEAIPDVHATNQGMIATV